VRLKLPSWIPSLALESEFHQLIPPYGRPADLSLEGTNNFQHPNSGFAQRIETTVHGIPHTFIGGQMISYESVFDPMFLGHHSMIENTFTMWQDCKNLEIRSTLKVSYPATTPRPGTPPPVPVPRSQPRNCTCHAGPDEPVRRKRPTHRFQQRVDR